MRLVGNLLTVFQAMPGSKKQCDRVGRRRSAICATCVHRQAPRRTVRIGDGRMERQRSDRFTFDLLISRVFVKLALTIYLGLATGMN